VRTGTPLADVAAIAPFLLGSVQVCDAPLRLGGQDPIEEAGFERGRPALERTRRVLEATRALLRSVAGAAAGA